MGVQARNNPLLQIKGLKNLKTLQNMECNKFTSHKPVDTMKTEWMMSLLMNAPDAE